MPNPRQTRNNVDPAIPAATTRGRTRSRKRGFRAGAATGGNMDAVAGVVNTKGLSAQDAIAFSGELHTLLNKYGIPWQ